MRNGIRSAGFVLAAIGAWSGAAVPAMAQDAADQHKALFSIVIEQVYNGGELALLDDLVATDVTSDGAPLGRDGFKAMVRDQRAKAAGARFRIDDIVTQDDRVIARVTPAGSTQPSRIVVVRIADNQIKEYWNFDDDPSLRRQFGLGTPEQRPPASN